MKLENRPGNRSVGGVVRVEAPVERVWQALTEGKELERWFPLEVRVRPGKGGNVWMSWKNEYVGDSTNLEWEPNRHLRISWGAPEGEGAASAQVTDYYLESLGDATIVRVVTSGFPDDSSWDAWVEGTRRGWEYELQSLKHYLEHHRDKDREVVYLRRRVTGTAEEAWRRIDLAEILGVELSAQPFIDDAPHQFAAVVPELGQALLRVSVDPCMADTQARDVTLWLASYGVGAERLDAISANWQALLERRFPEGSRV